MLAFITGLDRVTFLPGINAMRALLLIALPLLTCACTVQMAAPEKPITINLNVKIEHEVRVKVEKQLDNLFQQEDELF